MNWTKYGKIDNLKRSDISYKEISDSWILQEKIHGSNFSIIVTDNSVSYASRNRILKPEDDFHNYIDTMKKYVNSINQVWRSILSLYSKTVSITIYGEYFGGSYINNYNKPVQKGVLYCDHYDFIPFDIKVYFSNGDSTYLNWSTFRQIIFMSNFRLLDALKYGTLEQLMSIDPNNQQTQIPKLYGLENIKDNFAEGFIIRPISEVRDKFGNRILFKHKSAKFSERSKKKDDIILDDGVKLYLDELLRNININRLNSVISKEVDITIKDFGKLLKLLVKDAKDDVKIKLDKKWKRYVNKESTKLAKKIVKEHFA